MVPLIYEIPFADPLTAFAPLAGKEGSLLLHSASDSSPFSQYSFIAAFPFKTLMAKDGYVEEKEGDQTLFKRKGNPFDILQARLKKYQSSPIENLPPWQGGVAGYFGYDLGRDLEVLPKPRQDDMQFPDMALGFYDVIAAFDHRQKKAWIISSGWPEEQEGRRHKRAEERLKFLKSHLGHHPLPAIPTIPCLAPSLVSSQDEFEAGVRKIIDYILAGDIFQANLTRRIDSQLPDSLTAFDLYRRLMVYNAAPFSAFLTFPGVCLASASPERFLSLKNGHVETRPIKGTIKRSLDPKEDRMRAKTLRDSEKNCAENIMIVDLLRNDLSRVCAPKTVKTPEILAVETYATVHHLVSAITGTLKSGHDAIDLLKATFPGGSITGAPKIRAMEIIAELEPVARGPYCGAIGYIGFDGTMDTNIVIRTFAIKDDRVTFHVGGGIVADSDPHDEFEETQAKAAALLEALIPSKKEAVA